jgi:hypothetical protein
MSKLERAIEIIERLIERPSSRDVCRLLADNSIVLNFKEAKTVDDYFLGHSGSYWKESYAHPEIGDLLMSPFGPLRVEFSGLLTFSGYVIA